jgi:hypothetical protein
MYWSAITRPDLHDEEVKFRLKEGNNYTLFLNAEGFPSINVWCIDIEPDPSSGGFKVVFLDTESQRRAIRGHTKDYFDKWFVIRSRKHGDFYDYTVIEALKEKVKNSKS